MFQSSLPIKFWGDAVLTATYLINRIPTPVLGHKTPFQMLFGKVPSYSHLKVFGSLCFANTLPGHRTKFQPRGRKCVFIGYQVGIKGYKVYDLENHQVFVSRDVTFHESVFPFLSGSNVEVALDESLPLPCFQSNEASVDDQIVSQIPSPPVTSCQNTSPPVTSCPNSSPLVTKQSISVPSRVSNRTRNIPRYLDMYKTDLPPSLLNFTCEYPINDHLSTHNLASSYKSIVASVLASVEPETYDDAVKYEAWKVAMQEELSALESNGTWIVVEVPFDRHVVGCKWVYKIELRADGSVERFKARLVAKGYSQVEGFDFQETFSPVAKQATV